MADIRGLNTDSHCNFSLARLMETTLRQTEPSVQVTPGRIPSGTVLPERETGHLPSPNIKDHYVCCFAFTLCAMLL
jgi:hypothetical protein